jgi:hypothetical protein
MSDRPLHSPGDWHGRLATEADAEAILELLEASYDSWPSHEITCTKLDHLRWKLFSRDAVRRCQVVMEAGGRIIGLNAVFRQQIKLKDRLRSSYQFVDLAVLPAYQHRGVIPAARRFAIDARVPYGDVLFGPPRINPRPGSRARERKQPELRRNAYLRVVVLEGPVVLRARARTSTWLVRTPARLDGRFGGFWEEAARPFDLISAPDEEFLNWRYCDPRAGRWTVHTGEEDGRLLGYIAYRISNDHAYVGGLLALPERLDVVEGLLEEMMRALHRQGVVTAQCWSSSSHPYRAVLRDLGMDAKRRHVRITVHVEGEDVSELQRRDAALHIVAGDTDLV